VSDPTYLLYLHHTLLLMRAHTVVNLPVVVIMEGLKKGPMVMETNPGTTVCSSSSQPRHTP